MNTFRIILIFLVGFGTSYLNSQHNELYFHTINYGIKDGLKSATCVVSVQDNFGYIWVGTPYGVYRCDSKKMTSLSFILNNHDDDLGLNVRILYVDHQNKLWIGTYDEGLYVYDIVSNKLLSVKGILSDGKSIQTLNIGGIHELRDGIMRFMSTSHGLIDYYVQKDSLVIVEVTKDKEWVKRLNGFQLLLSPIKDKQNKVIKNWYSSLAGLVEYVPGIDSFIYHNPPNRIKLGVRSAIMDEDGVIWTANYSEGIYSYNTFSNIWTNFRCTSGDDSFVNCLNSASINVYDNTSIIVGTNHDGLYFLNKKTGNFTRFFDEIPHSLMPENPNHMKWYGGNLWISSLDKGLFAHQPNAITHNINYQKETLCRVIYDEMDSAMISTYYDEQYFKIHKNGTEQKIKIPEKFITGGNLNWVEMDGTHRLWFASETSIFFYDLTNNRFKKVLKSSDLIQKYQDISFRRIIDDKHGHIWSSSQDGHLVKINTKTLTYHFIDKNTLSHSYSNYIDVGDKEGYLYIKSGSGGFFVYDPVKDTFVDDENLFDSNGKRFEVPSSVELGLSDDTLYFANNIHAIYKIKRGNLDKQVVDTLQAFKKLPPYKVTDLMVHMRKLWMTTQNGLAMIDLGNGKDYFYGVKEGLTNLRKISNGSKNSLLIYSNNEIHTIVPGELNNVPKDHHIILQYGIIYNSIKTDTTFFPKEELVMRPNDVSLKLRFDNLNYSSTENTEFAINLYGGKEDKWEILGFHNEYLINGLDGGKYDIFLKTKLKNETEWSTPEKIIRIIVINPLTKRPIFWVGLAALIASLLWVYINWKLRLQKSKQALIIAFNKKIAETEMKALRAQMNPHFLFNVLNAIKLNIQKNEQSEAISFISDFSKLIRAVLHNSSLNLITLQEELDILEIYIKIEKKRFASGFTYSMVIEEELDLEKINLPPLVLQPYVENAIWHGLLHKTEAGAHINIHVSKELNSYIIRIKDNGIGRTKAELIKSKSASNNKSLGMKITKDRIDINNQISNRNKLKVNIFDLYENGEASGTEAVVEIEEE
ncbi:MAG: histidine kinase [Saprospiraceae bacterium]